MSAHTPGPWKYVRGSHGIFTIGGGVAVALVYGPRKVECERRDANARLIAAAPELLEALREYLSADHAAEGYGSGIGDERLRQSARIAIAKATGEAA